MRRALTCFVAGVLCMSAPSSSARAQGANPVKHFPNTTPVLLVLSDGLPNVREGIRIVRRPGVKPHDVILVSRSHLTEDYLVEAMLTLDIARAHDGLIPSKRIVHPIVAANPGATWPYSREEAAFWIKALTSIPKQQLEGLGEARAITLHVPNRKLTISEVPAGGRRP